MVYLEVPIAFFVIWYWIVLSLLTDKYKPHLPNPSNKVSQKKKYKYFYKLIFKNYSKAWQSRLNMMQK